MKLFAFIMSIAMLALIGLPCQDAEASTLNAGNAHTAAAGTEKQGNNEEHAHHDLCSPFCACACCSVTYIYTPFIYATLIGPSYKTDHFSCYAADLASASLPIWQPPQLAA